MKQDDGGGDDDNDDDNDCKLGNRASALAQQVMIFLFFLFLL
jgi:hypothetical protein